MLAHRLGLGNHHLRVALAKPYRNQARTMDTMSKKLGVGKVRMVSSTCAMVAGVALLGVGVSHPVGAESLRLWSTSGPIPRMGGARTSIRVEPVKPTVFSFGMANGPGAVAQLTAGGSDFAYRYQYLAGGANTGSGWATWNQNGEFASNYMKESADNGFTPVFTFYQLLQSKPGNGKGEDEKDYNNLIDKSTMRAYYSDFALLLDKVRTFGRPVIIHVEPDLSGYMQQRVVDSTNSAASIAAAVADTGIAELNGLSNTYQGFNQALLRLRDRHAPNALLAMHVSAWSTKIDVSTTTDRSVDVGAAARSAAQFLKTAGVDSSAGDTSSYDYLFVDASDRDAGFHQIVNGDGGAHWWDETNAKLPNFASFEKYVGALTAATQRSLFVWQVPIGNTIMRSQNNTWNHYQDNRVQYWLGGYPSDGHLASLARSGVIGILWGRGADGGTSFDDSAKDGITNPPQINGNDRASTATDDDGGYLRERMRAYKAAPLSIGAPSTVQPLTTTSSSPTGGAPTGSAGSTAPPTAIGRPGGQVVAATAVAVAKSGRRRITFRVTPTAGPAIIHVEVDKKVVGGLLRVPAPTAKSPYTTLSIPRVPFAAGGHTVTFHVDSGQATVSNVKVS